jgi:hypothetical protein
MPQIIVATDRGAAFGQGAVTFRERVNVADLESEHYAAQLLERLGWAVEDAHQAERVRDQPGAVRDETEAVSDETEEINDDPEWVPDEPVAAHSPV